jgi:hypothetical protein
MGYIRLSQFTGQTDASIGRRVMRKSRSLLAVPVGGHQPARRRGVLECRRALN